MMFLLTYLRQEIGPEMEGVMNSPTHVTHIFPLCCLKPWPIGRYFVLFIFLIQKLTFLQSLNISVTWFTGANTEFCSIPLSVRLQPSFLCMKQLRSQKFHYSLFLIFFWLFYLRICEVAGVFEEGKFKVDVAYPYIIAINNLSQFIAMYHLVVFYRAYREALKPMKPIGKFLCIKAVVFFSFL